LAVTANEAWPSGFDAAFDKRSNSIVALHHKKLYVIGFLRVIMYADNRPRSKTQHVVCQLIPCEARISLQLIG